MWRQKKAVHLLYHHVRRIRGRLVLLGEPEGIRVAVGNRAAVRADGDRLKPAGSGCT